MSFIILPVQKNEYLEIVEVWEVSVRATHLFLEEKDFQFFKPLILNEYLKMVELACIKNENNNILGFSGVLEEKLEMLFVKPEAMGKGVGKKLLQHAIQNQSVKTVDVNEQNPAAVNFYLHMGFKPTGRSELDGMGKPFPLLHMEL